MAQVVQDDGPPAVATLTGNASTPSDSGSIYGPNSAVATSKPVEPTKAGRKPNFSANDDLILTREVAAAKAHTAPYGEVQQRFKKAAHNANVNPALVIPVTHKSIQNRYKKVQDTFDKGDSKNRLMSDVGGEVTELEELLSSTRDAREDLNNKLTAEKDVLLDAERKKKETGDDLVRRSLKRVGNRELPSDCGEIKAKKRCDMSISPGRHHQSGLADFVEALRESDMSRIELERQRFEFEKMRYAQEVKDREVERIERKEERKEQNEVDLKKFKMMLDMMRGTRSD